MLVQLKNFNGLQGEIIGMHEWINSADPLNESYRLLIR
jgi:hypothetical protein